MIPLLLYSPSKYYPFNSIDLYQRFFPLLQTFLELFSMLMLFKTSSVFFTFPWHQQNFSLISGLSYEGTGKKWHGARSGE